MAKLTNIEQLRRRRARQKLGRNLMLLAVLGAIVLAASMVVSNLGRNELKAAVSDIRAEISSGDGYPVPLPGGRFVRLESMGNALLLQTDTHFYTYNDTGKQMMNLQHGMGNVALSIGRDRMLAFDRGGTKLQFFSRSAALESMDAKFTIYDADLGARGNFAVATGSDEYLAQVTVYNSDLQDIFYWYSAERPIISVAVSNDKEAMVVGCIDVKDGVYHSDIQKFQFNMDKAVAQAELEQGELLLALDYHAANGIRAITDTRVVLFSPELKELKEHRMTGQKLIRFWMQEDGRVLMVTHSVTGGKENLLTVLNPDFSVAAQIPVSEGLLTAQADRERIYLTDRSSVRVLKLDGGEEQVIMANGLHGSQLMNEKLYYASGSELNLVEEKTSAVKPGLPKKSPSEEEQASTSSSGQTASASEAEDAAASTGQTPAASGSSELISTEIVDEKKMPEGLPEEPSAEESQPELETTGV